MLPRWRWTERIMRSPLVALLTWQPLRDQPLLQPDALTLGARAGLIVAVGATLE